MNLRNRAPIFWILTIWSAAIGVAQTPPLTPDIPAEYEAPTLADDYVKREVVIPMRDGVKLHTVIVVPSATSRPAGRGSCR
jgi:uncharacterized protein